MKGEAMTMNINMPCSQQFDAEILVGGHALSQGNVNPQVQACCTQGPLVHCYESLSG
jgi:hypothetical protein